MRKHLGYRNAPMTLITRSAYHEEQQKEEEEFLTCLFLPKLQTEVCISHGFTEYQPGDILYNRSLDCAIWLKWTKN